MPSLFQSLKAAIKGQTLKAKKESIRFAPAQKIKFGSAKPKKGLFRAIAEAIKSKFTRPEKATTAEIRKQIRKGVVKAIPRPATPPRPATQPTGPAYVPPDLLDEYLHLGKIISTIDTSTNVQAMQYDADHKLLYIWFHGGNQKNRRYTYAGVDEAKARRFYEAASRGHWVWAEIRWPGYGYLDKRVSRPPI